MMFANSKKTINKVNARVEDDLKAIISIGVEICGVEELAELIRKLNGIDGVTNVYRV